MDTTGTGSWLLAACGVTIVEYWRFAATELVNC